MEVTTTRAEGSKRRAGDTDGMWIRPSGGHVMMTVTIHDNDDLHHGAEIEPISYRGDRRTSTDNRLPFALGCDLRSTLTEQPHGRGAA